MSYYVYIMTNARYTTLYTGVTNNLERRAYQHKHHLLGDFTSRYRVGSLIYYEVTADVESAIRREKQIKGWTRARKIALIESQNPHWRDLSDSWNTLPTSRPFAEFILSGVARFFASLRMTGSEGLRVTEEDEQ